VRSQRAVQSLASVEHAACPIGHAILASPKGTPGSSLVEQHGLLSLGGFLSDQPNPQPTASSA
jgi:hypothetical protein